MAALQIFPKHEYLSSAFNIHFLSDFIKGAFKCLGKLAEAEFWQKDKKKKKGGLFFLYNKQSLHSVIGYRLSAMLLLQLNPNTYAAFSRSELNPDVFNSKLVRVCL